MSEKATEARLNLDRVIELARSKNPSPYVGIMAREILEHRLMNVFQHDPRLAEQARELIERFLRPEEIETTMGEYAK